MKNSFFLPAVICILGILLEIYWWTSKAPLPKQSDLEVIFAYIDKPSSYTNNAEDQYFYSVDSDFRTFSLKSKAKASSDRAEVIYKVLSQKIGSSLITELDINCLVTPYAGKKIDSLRLRTSRGGVAKDRLVLLTFSAPCPMKDSKIYYYVERVSQANRQGAADVFVLKNGLIISVINIWTN